MSNFIESLKAFSTDALGTWAAINSGAPRPPGYDQAIAGAQTSPYTPADIGRVLVEKLPDAYGSFQSSGGGIDGFGKALLELFRPKANPGPAATDNLQPQVIRPTTIPAPAPAPDGLEDWQKALIGVVVVGIGAAVLKAVLKRKRR